MRGTAILRSLAVAAFTALLCGCHFNTRTATGMTPQPSNTTIAQSNSTSSPTKHLSTIPAQKYIAQTAAGLKDVTFAIWANGRPIGTISWPSKSLDLTGDMRGHANVLVIQWTRTAKDGKGMMTIDTEPGGKTVLTARVSPSSPEKGSVSKTLIAPRSAVGRPHG
jgi:hypothetical protein